MSSENLLKVTITNKVLNSDDDSRLKRVHTDVSAFDVIYERYLIPVYRYVFVRVHNQFDAEDITSHVFLNALENILAGKYQYNNRFAAWLFTIARRRIADYYRKPVDCSLEEYGVRTKVDQNSFNDGDERAEELSAYFSRLTNFEQDLLALRFSAQMGFKEIGQIFNKSETAVRMATYRALKKLRTSMRGEFHGS